MELTPGTSMEMRYCTGNPNSAKGLTWRKITIITAPFDKPGYEQGPVVEVDDSGQFKFFYIDRILETRPLSRRGLSLERFSALAIVRRILLVAQVLCAAAQCGCVAMGLGWRR